MKYPLLSIIIPIYNVADYLPACLNSLYAQYEAESMVVILVNDGSTDDSLSVCKEYIKRYPETKLINKPNRGLSDARNAGTAIATGKYIYYLDSDDWISSDALMVLYRFAIRYQCEVVQGGFYYAYDNHLLYDNYLNKYKNPILLTRNEAMKALIENRYIKNFAWGKLYRADIAKKYPFRKGTCFEDAYWQHLIMNEVTSYGIVAKPLYYYRQRDNSISGNFSLRNMDLLKGYEERIDFIRIYDPNYQNIQIRFFWRIAFSFYQISQSHPQEEVRKQYSRYWEHINHLYPKEFHQALKYSLTYHLVNNHPIVLPGYLFLKRVLNHFRPSSFKRIDIQ